MSRPSFMIGYVLPGSIPREMRGQSGFRQLHVISDRIGSISAIATSLHGLTIMEWRRVRTNQIKLGTNAFFFREGDDHYYQRARYGEARKDTDGQFLLAGLRDENLRKLGPHN